MIYDFKGSSGCLVEIVGVTRKNKEPSLEVIGLIQREMVEVRTRVEVVEGSRKKLEIL